MINNLKILDIWSIVEHDYEPKFNPIAFCLTIEIQIEKKHNDCTVNAILNLVSEPIILVFDNITSASDM
jgi:hypothetical protein